MWIMKFHDWILSPWFLLFLSGLDHSSRWVCGILLRRGMRLPIECPHERFESCDRADADASDGTFEGAEAVLRADQGFPDFRSLFRWWFQRDTQEISKYGGENVRLPLTSCETSFVPKFPSPRHCDAFNSKVFLVSQVCYSFMPFDCDLLDAKSGTTGVKENWYIKIMKGNNLVR